MNIVLASMEVQGEKLRACVHALHDSEVVFEVYRNAHLIQYGMAIRDFVVYVNDEAVAIMQLSVGTIHDSVIGYSYFTAWVKERRILEFQEQLYNSCVVMNDVLETAKRIVSEVDEHKKRIEPSFKECVNDVADQLTDIREKLLKLMPDFEGAVSGSDKVMQQKILDWERSGIILKVESEFRRFEKQAALAPKVHASFYKSYAHKKLASILRDSDLLKRTIDKPMGYAGDFVTIMYILKILKVKDLTLFGYLLSQWTLKQEPSVAHQNRIKKIAEYISNEIVDILNKGYVSDVKVLNLGCGPAEELKYIKNLDLKLDMTMLDFSEEALDYVESSFKDYSFPGRGIAIRTRHIDMIEYQKEIKEHSQNKYSIIYCAGLMDYCSDNRARRLINSLSNMLEPGGVAIFTNVNTVNPYSFMMNWVLDWVLHERCADRFRSLAPLSSNFTVEEIDEDATKVNLFLKIRNSGTGAK